MRVYGMSVAVTALAAVSAQAQQGTRQVFHIDDQGARVERLSGTIEGGAAHAGATRGQEVLWQYHHVLGIANTVAIADSANDTWGALELNAERMLAFDTDGDGTPVYEFEFEAETPDGASVASAEDGSLGVLFTSTLSNGVKVRAFTKAGGNTPVWTYDFPAGVDGVSHNAATVHWVDVSADGSIVATVGTNLTTSEAYVAILDGATGAELVGAWFTPVISAVELSDDGSRAILTQGATALVVDTSNLQVLHSFSVIGSGSFHRLSRDGRVAVAGGFNYVAWREDEGGNWQLVLNRTSVNNWFGGMAVSGDGQTMFVVSHNYLNYLELTYRVIDLNTGVEIAQTTTTGAGVWQDAVKVAQVSDDGEVLAICSWGTQDNVHPEVQVFDRDLNLIGGVDLPGSAFHMDLSRDGSRLAVAGKGVHANEFGNSGDIVAYQVFQACPADLDGSGTVDVTDLGILLANFGQSGSGIPGDVDGDDDVDISDLGSLLSQFGTVCS